MKKYLIVFGSLLSLTPTFIGPLFSHNVSNISHKNINQSSYSYSDEVTFDYDSPQLRGWGLSSGSITFSIRERDPTTHDMRATIKSVSNTFCIDSNGILNIYPAFDYYPDPSNHDVQYRCTIDTIESLVPEAMTPTSSSSLKTLDISSSITLIKSRAFAGYRQLTDVHIFDAHEIDADVFDECTNLQNIYLYNNTNTIPLTTATTWPSGYEGKFYVSDKEAYAKYGGDLTLLWKSFYDNNQLINFDSSPTASYKPTLTISDDPKKQYLDIANQKVGEKYFDNAITITKTDSSGVKDPGTLNARYVTGVSVLDTQNYREFKDCDWILSSQVHPNTLDLYLNPFSTTIPSEGKFLLKITIYDFMFSLYDRKEDFSHGPSIYVPISFIEDQPHVSDHFPYGSINNIILNTNYFEFTVPYNSKRDNIFYIGSYIPSDNIETYYQTSTIQLEYKNDLIAKHHFIFNNDNGYVFIPHKTSGVFEMALLCSNGEHLSAFGIKFVKMKKHINWKWWYTVAVTSGGIIVVLAIVLPPTLIKRHKNHKAYKKT